MPARASTSATGYGLRVQVAGEPDQLADRDLLHQAAALQHRADPPGDDRLARASCRRAATVPLSACLQPEQQVQGGGLARAVGAEQGHGLARVQGEGQPVHGPYVAVRLASPGRTLTTASRWSSSAVVVM